MGDPQAADEGEAAQPALYHFTCDHGFKGIGRYGGLVMPAATHHPEVVARLEPAQALLAQVCWFTTVPEVTAPDLLGLGGTMLRCDRTTHRYTVDGPNHVIRWAGLRHTFIVQLAQRHPDPVGWVIDLERYGDPDLWWVSASAVKVRYDPVGITRQ